MYINEDTIGKEYCRNIIYEIAKKLPREAFGKRPTIFTLPSYNFSLEERLSTLPISLHCAENNREVYTKQIKSPVYKRVKKNFSQFYLYHQNLDAFDALAGCRTYTLIHLDLCQSFQVSLINRWLSFIQRVKITKEAYIGITIMGRRENQSHAIQEYYNCTLQEFRNTIFPKLTVQFANLAGRECTLIEKYNYKGESQSPMIFYLFKFNL